MYCFRYLMLADIIPTSYEIGLVDGAMADGKTVAIVGVAVTKVVVLSREAVKATGLWCAAFVLF